MTPGRYRWRICALLFAATTLNYVDRQVLGVLAPDLTARFGWSEVQYSTIVTAFQLAYAVGLLGAGALIDKLGTRIGYAVAICVWSIAAMSHALAGSALGFAAARFLLGLGEAGNFPAAIKTVAEWFPRRERAFATGIFNSGTNLGAILAPLAVPIVAVTWGWQAAFLFTGVLSAIWLVTWLKIYRPPAQHPKVSGAELELIRSDPEEPSTRVPWAQLLRHRQVWAFAAAKFITDPVWWFFLFWLPKFLNSEYGLTLTSLGPPLIAIYLLADVGSIAGGWLAGRFIRAWLERQQSAQGSNAGVRALRRTHRFRVVGPQRVDRRCADRPGNRRSSGLVGKCLHAHFGHVSPARRCLSRGAGWIGRRSRWHARLDVCGFHARCHRQLRAGFHDGRRCVSARAGRRAPAGAETRAGEHPKSREVIHDHVDSAGLRPRPRNRLRPSDRHLPGAQFLSR